MSYLDTITPKIALETFGLRRDEPHMADLVMPVLAAFGLGLGVGAGVALLLAPQTGRDLRDDLRERAGKLEKNVRNALPNNYRASDLNPFRDSEIPDHSSDLEYDSSMSRSNPT